MVAYSDVPAVNLLYQEQAIIDNGIAMLDAGGTISNFTVAPPPYDPAAPSPSPMMMHSQIATVDPAPELITAARDAMVARHNAITAEIAALGVTEAPPTI